jgi:hypothetical protein
VNDAAGKDAASELVRVGLGQPPHTATSSSTGRANPRLCSCSKTVVPCS